MGTDKTGDGDQENTGETIAVRSPISLQLQRQKAVVQSRVRECWAGDTGQGLNSKCVFTPLGGNQSGVFSEIR